MQYTDGTFIVALALGGQPHAAHADGP
jgi:hypothetical protein